jgi:hypothetical protein
MEEVKTRVEQNAAFRGKKLEKSATTGEVIISHNKK